MSKHTYQKKPKRMMKFTKNQGACNKYETGTLVLTSVQNNTIIVVNIISTQPTTSSMSSK